MLIIQTGLLAAKREAAFCNVKFYQQLKNVASLIKFNAERVILRYIASLRKVTLTMAVTVKRLPFFNFFVASTSRTLSLIGRV